MQLHAAWPGLQPQQKTGAQQAPAQRTADRPARACAAAAQRQPLRSLPVQAAEPPVRQGADVPGLTPLLDSLKWDDRGLIVAIVQASRAQAGAAAAAAWAPLTAHGAAARGHWRGAHAGLCRPCCGGGDSPDAVPACLLRCCRMPAKQDMRLAQLPCCTHLADSTGRTLARRLATFYSRSRGGRWCKGETSGHFINVTGVYADCDADSLVYLGEPVGPACHTVLAHSRARSARLQRHLVQAVGARRLPASPASGCSPSRCRAGAQGAPADRGPRAQGRRTCWFRQLELPEGEAGPVHSNGAGQQQPPVSREARSPLPTLQALEQTIQRRAQQGSSPGVQCSAPPRFRQLEPCACRLACCALGGHKSRYLHSRARHCSRPASRVTAASHGARSSCAQGPSRHGLPGSWRTLRCCAARCAQCWWWRCQQPPAA